MRILFLVIVLIFTTLHAKTQPGFSEPFEQNCGSDEHHAWLMKTNPAYRSNHLHQKAILDSLNRATVTLDRNIPPIYTIPIVVHVIHLGEQIGVNSNISDEQILEAIRGLNERYANANGQGTDTEINFCLANRDPNGCPTSGINRVDGSVVPGYEENGITWDGSCGVDEHPIKDLSKWPTDDYYNIWVVTDICGEIAGYAYYPNGDEYDGTVIDIVSMKYDNGTLSHELGHGLNLQHTFTGDDGTTCPQNANCMEDGDGICDTPPHRQNDCGNSSPCATEGEWLNTRNNWMSYCHPDYASGKFTEDQRTRMRNAMSVYPRLDLLSSEGCANEVSMRITSDGSLLCSGDSRVLTAQPEGGVFVIASGDGTIEGNVLTAEGGLSILVEYIITGDNCTSSAFQVIPVKHTPQSILKSGTDNLCIGQSTTLQGIPGGGTYSLVSGPGILDSNLLIAEGAGMITVLYEKLLLGCVSRDTHVVTSYAAPLVDIEMLADDLLTAVPDTGEFQWLRCDLDYEVIEDATGAHYFVNTSGSYAVVAINGVCRDTSSCIAVEATATQDGKEDLAFAIYPNPVHDVLFVQGAQLQNDFTATVFDMRGLPLASQNISGQNIQFDLSGFTDGVYVLQVDVRGVGRFVYRVVKI